MSDLSQFSNEFDSVPESTGGEWPTAGEFPVVLLDSGVKNIDTKDGPATKVYMKFKVESGVHENRHINLDFFVRSPKEAAKNIGIKGLKNVFKALGFESVPPDSTDAHGRSCKIKVKLWNGYPSFISASPLASEEDSPF